MSGMELDIILMIVILIYLIVIAIKDGLFL